MGKKNDHFIPHSCQMSTFSINGGGIQSIKIKSKKNISFHFFVQYAGEMYNNHSKYSRFHDSYNGNFSDIVNDICQNDFQKLQKDFSKSHTIHKMKESNFEIPYLLLFLTSEKNF